MATISLDAEPRTIIGKKVKTLRRKGITPANIYGPGLPSAAIQLDTRILQKTLVKVGPKTVIALAVGDASRTVKVKEVQVHPVTGVPLHVDFYQAS